MSFTGNVTCTIGEGLAPNLGRKGTVSDVTLYNHKQGDCVLAFIEPSSYSDKIQSLITSLTMSDQVLFKVSEIDSFFAETVVALDAAQIPVGYIILDGNLQSGGLEAITKDTVLSNYSIVEEQVVPLREKLASLNLDNTGDAIVLVDHCFSVRGVGTVALGVVKHGVIKKHDELFISPGDGKTLVKSMQIHDIDSIEASTGVRVGLALKDVKPEDIPRGTLLSTTKRIETSKTLELESMIEQFSYKAS